MRRKGCKDLGPRARHARSKVLSFRGRRLTVAEWARELGGEPEKDAFVLYQRVNKLGWSAERALGTPLRARRDRGKR